MPSWDNFSQGKFYPRSIVDNHLLGTMWRVKDLAESGLGCDASEIAVADENALRVELLRLASLEARVVGIELSSNEYLQIGLGGSWAFVEHIVDEPWKAEVALPRSITDSQPDSVWFVCGGQGSEIPAKFLLSKEEAIQIVVDFLRLGVTSTAWKWELI